MCLTAAAFVLNWLFASGEAEMLPWRCHCWFSSENSRACATFLENAFVMAVLMHVINFAAASTTQSLTLVNSSEMRHTADLRIDFVDDFDVIVEPEMSMQPDCFTLMGLTCELGVRGLLFCTSFDTMRQPSTCAFT